MASAPPVWTVWALDSCRLCSAPISLSGVGKRSQAAVVAKQMFSLVQNICASRNYYHTSLRRCALITIELTEQLTKCAPIELTEQSTRLVQCYQALWPLLGKS